MTEEYPTQRTRFWLAFFYPSALVINAGIIATVLVMPRVPNGFKWAAAIAAVLSLVLALLKGRQFKRRYSL